MEQKSVYAKATREGGFCVVRWVGFHAIVMYMLAAAKPLESSAALLAYTSFIAGAIILSVFVANHFFALAGCHAVYSVPASVSCSDPSMLGAYTSLSGWSEIVAVLGIPLMLYGVIASLVALGRLQRQQVRNGSWWAQVSIAVLAFCMQLAVMAILSGVVPFL